jgi:hypothetical protein
MECPELLSIQSFSRNKMPLEIPLLKREISKVFLNTLIIFNRLKINLKYSKDFDRSPTEMSSYLRYMKKAENN